MSMLNSARSACRWSRRLALLCVTVTPLQRDNCASSSPAGRLPTSASPTLVSLASSTRSAGRCGSAAADVSLWQPRMVRRTSDGGRPASDASVMAACAAARVRSARRCAKLAAGRNRMHHVTSSSSRPAGSDASMAASRASLEARSTRRWVRCASDTLPAGEWLRSSSCSEVGRRSTARQTFIQRVSSTASAGRCANPARAVRLPHPRTFSSRSEAGRRHSSSSVTLLQPCASRCVVPTNATAPAPVSMLFTARHVSRAPTADRNAARHRTTSTTGVTTSHHGTPATAPRTAGCSRRRGPVSVVTREARMMVDVTLLPASTRTSGGTSSTSYVELAVAIGAAGR